MSTRILADCLWIIDGWWHVQEGSVRNNVLEREKRRRREGRNEEGRKDERKKGEEGRKARMRGERKEERQAWFPGCVRKGKRVCSRARRNTCSP